MTQLELVPTPTWPDNAVASIYKAFPRHEYSKVAHVSIRKALDRVVDGEIDGKPRTQEEAIHYLREKSHEARGQMFGRLSKHIPLPSTYFNQSRYLLKQSEDIPKELGECKSILEAYPNIKIRPSNIDAYMPVLRTIATCIEELQPTHGQAAASYIRQRVYRFAECVAKWDASEMQFIPSPAKFFSERRFDNDERRWARKAPRGFESERAQLDRVMGKG